MLVLTHKEKRALFLLLFCFLLGVFLYYLQEGELAVGREQSAPSKLEWMGKKVQLKQIKKLNINTATQSQLEALPGVGLKTAQNILEYRKANRRFYRIEEIKEVKGIGENKFQKLAQFIKIR